MEEPWNRLDRKRFLVSGDTWFTDPSSERKKKRCLPSLFINKIMYTPLSCKGHNLLLSYLDMSRGHLLIKCNWGQIPGGSLFFSPFLQANISWYCCSLFSRSLWLYKSSCNTSTNNQGYSVQIWEIFLPRGMWNCWLYLLLLLSPNLLLCPSWTLNTGGW